MLINFIATDRGVNQHGSIYFVTKDNQLVRLDEENQFKNVHKLAELPQKSEIMGALFRYHSPEDS